MAKKKEELKEVKEVVKVPLLQNENENENETIDTDVRPFCINFGKSWLKCEEIISIIEEDPETGGKRQIVTMYFDGQLNGDENSELTANEIQFSGNIEEE